MVDMLIIAVGSILLVTLLMMEHRQRRYGVLVTKSLLSSLFVVTAMLQPSIIPDYRRFVLLALIFCLAGDIFLVFEPPRIFFLGLIAFLVGHLWYIAAFSVAAKVGAGMLIGALAVMFAGSMVYRWLRPHLGEMRVPVLLYIGVISVMTAAGWGVWGNSGWSLWGRLMVVGGASCFYVSDIFVARDRFLKKSFSNRLLGLPLYYGAQFLLAFSVAQVKTGGAV